MEYFLLAFGLTLAVIALWHFTPKGWLTIAVNSLAGVPIVLMTGIGDLVDALTGFDFQQFLSQKEAALIALGLVIFNVARRAFAEPTPAGSGEPVR